MSSCFGSCGISALGSLCESICGFCSVGSIFNCSRTQTIIVPNEAILSLFNQNVHAGNPLQRSETGLKELIKNAKQNPELQLTLKTIPTVEKIKVPVGDQINDERGVLAIELIAHCAITTWMAKSDNFADSWGRFESSYQRAGLDLNNRFTAKQPISAGEKKELDKKIEETSTYGSLAADLFQKVWVCKGDWGHLKDVVLGSEKDKIKNRLIQFLSRNLNSGDFSHNENAECPSFAGLLYTIQAIFIKAVSQNYPRHYIKEHSGDYVVWAKDEPKQFIEQEEKSDSSLHHAIKDKLSPQATTPSSDPKSSLLNGTDNPLVRERRFTFHSANASQPSTKGQENKTAALEQRSGQLPYSPEIRVNSASRNNQQAQAEKSPNSRCGRPPTATGSARVRSERPPRHSKTEKSGTGTPPHSLSPVSRQKKSYNEDHSLSSCESPTEKKRANIENEGQEARSSFTETDPLSSTSEAPTRGRGRGRGRGGAYLGVRHWAAPTASVRGYSHSPHRIRAETRFTRNSISGEEERLSNPLPRSSSDPKDQSKQFPQNSRKGQSPLPPMNLHRRVADRRKSVREDNETLVNFAPSANEDSSD